MQKFAFMDRIRMEKLNELNKNKTMVEMKENKKKKKNNV